MADVQVGYVTTVDADVQVGFVIRSRRTGRVCREVQPQPELLGRL